LLNREAAKERKIFRFTEFLSQKWDDVFKKYNKYKIDAYIKSSISTGIAMCFSMSIILIFGLFLLLPLKAGTITIGLYASLLMAVANNMNMCISSIIREFTNSINIKHYIKDIKDFLKLKIICSKQEEQVDPIKFESIRLEDVYFCYPGTEQYILNGVSFEIKQGNQCALIGLNGAGKTTITKLMLGLYKPTKGKIYLNDKDLSSYSYTQIRLIFASMQQNHANYKLTFGENVSLYNLSYRENVSKMDETLEKCNIYDVKERCKNSYDTILTPEYDGGVMLSGGEWQKVEIARTFFADRDFIILDEPTAALDPIAEVDFYSTYKKIMIGHTCLFITHRLGSTYLFECCYVLSDGKIAEQGTHNQLMEIPDGIYKNLYNKQREWYRKETVEIEKNV
jgi:ATP-binding cassette subfamily B protein